MKVLRRAVRSVPGSGEVWARYIRFLVSFSYDMIYYEMYVMLHALIYAHRNVFKLTQNLIIPIQSRVL